MLRLCQYAFHSKWQPQERISCCSQVHTTWLMETFCFGIMAALYRLRVHTQFAHAGDGDACWSEEMCLACGSNPPKGRRLKLLLPPTKQTRPRTPSVNRVLQHIGIFAVITVTPKFQNISANLTAQEAGMRQLVLQLTTERLSTQEAKAATYHQRLPNGPKMPSYPFTCRRCHFEAGLSTLS